MFSPPVWPTQRIQQMMMYRPRNSNSKSHVCQIDGCNRSYYHKHHLHRHQSSAHGVQGAPNLHDASITQGAMTAPKLHGASNIHDASYILGTITTPKRNAASNIHDASNIQDSSNIQDAPSIGGAISCVKYPGIDQMSRIHQISSKNVSPVSDKQTNTRAGTIP